MVSMDNLADRFFLLQRRFVEFSEQAHVLLRVWLSRQQVESLEIRLDCLADHLFSLEGIVISERPAPSQWMKTIARCALEDQLSCVPYTQYDSNTVVFSNIPSSLFMEWPCYTRLCAVMSESRRLSREDDETAMLRRRNAVLEVRVGELEAKLASGVKPLKRVSKTLAPVRLPEFTIEDTVSFLYEKRFDAEDSIALLKRLNEEFVGRKRVLDKLCSDQNRRFSEQRRSDAKTARTNLALAADQITRLRAEVEELKASAADSSSKTQSKDSAPIVPRRALVIAGFWNVTHNDVLLITPRLVEKFERVVGKTIRHRDFQVCFPAKDQPVLIDLVAEVMAEHLPQYERTG